MYRLSLQASAKLANDKSAYAEFYFHPWVSNAVTGAVAEDLAGIHTFSGTTAEQNRVYLESAYLDMPFANGKLRIGKGRQLNFGMVPNAPNRKTSQYYILSETFTQDRIQGFQYSQKQGAFDCGLSLFVDPRIGSKKIGDTPGLGGNKTVLHLVEKEDNANLSGSIGYSGRFGFTTPCWKLHVSGAAGSLVQADATAIAAAYGTTTTNKDHTKYGVDAMYSKGNVIASGEWYSGQFSLLGIDGYSLLLGYEPKDSRRVYVRYSALNNDMTPLANPLTWNNQQLLFGITQPLTKGAWVELNYEKNTQSTGGGAAEVDNDVFLVEFFTGF
jgi:hypothetical protein